MDQKYLIPSSMEELEDEYYSCSDAIGLHGFDFSIYEKWLAYWKKKRERLSKTKE